MFIPVSIALNHLQFTFCLSLFKHKFKKIQNIKKICVVLDNCISFMSKLKTLWLFQKDKNSSSKLIHNKRITTPTHTGTRMYVTHTHTHTTMCVHNYFEKINT